MSGEFEETFQRIAEHQQSKTVSKQKPAPRAKRILVRRRISMMGKRWMSTTQFAAFHKCRLDHARNIAYRAFLQGLLQRREMADRTVQWRRKR